MKHQRGLRLLPFRITEFVVKFIVLSKKIRNLYFAVKHLRHPIAPSVNGPLHGIHTMFKAKNRVVYAVLL